jgi:DNA-directed RNA polymerase subunit M
MHICFDQADNAADIGKRDFGVVLNMFKFCKCGGILVPTGNVMKCRKCGKEQPKAEHSSTLLKTAHEEKKIAVLETNESNLPSIEHECEKCGNAMAYYWFIQTRASDEPPTRFFRCTKCEHTTREYS